MCDIGWIAAGFYRGRLILAPFGRRRCTIHHADDGWNGIRGNERYEKRPSNN